MSTFKNFRTLALKMTGAIESAHMGHPDFRVGGRIFATLHADLKWGMVKLTPDQQQTFVRENAKAFSPEKGAWGRSGCTRVRLESVDEDTLGEAMTLAWQNIVKKAVVHRPDSSRQPPSIPSSRQRRTGLKKPR
ncbi:MAG: MmcQ/YjbR family DNA-binding protein [Acidobacteriia bacterium]|nr:MmcQ/YjbR family DNA-binding protein [Terriglobia bacterium]